MILYKESNTGSATGTGTLCSSWEIKFCIFPSSWHRSHLFTYFITSQTYYAKKVFPHIFGMLSFFPVALDLQLSPIPSWMSWIICCVPSLDLIASLLPLYIKFPPRIAIFLEPFSSFSFFYRLRGKKFLYEEIVSTSALMCNIRNQD